MPRFRTILMLNDTPHSIALGTATGLFVAWTPTVGIHMILVVALCLALRANKVAGLIAAYISNPLTVAPMYWITYKLGAVALKQSVPYAEFAALVHYTNWPEWRQAFWRLCIDLAGPMWTGGLVLALAHAIPGYYLTRSAVARFRGRSKPAALGTAQPATPSE